MPDDIYTEDELLQAQRLQQQVDATREAKSQGFVSGTTLREVSRRRGVYDRQKTRKREVFAWVAGVSITIILVLLLTASLSYGGVERSWADVQAMYQRRFDTLPALVQSAEVGAEENRKTIAVLVGEAKSAKTIASQQQAFLVLQASLQELSPGSSTTAQLYSDLGAEIAGSNNRVAQMLRVYNDSVAGFRNMQRINPFAAFFYPTPETFSASTEAQAMPQDLFGDR